MEGTFEDYEADLEDPLIGKRNRGKRRRVPHCVSVPREFRIKLEGEGSISDRLTV